MGVVSKVSIGMPVFNCERTIARAIVSITNQTFKDWELLIIDDGSTDETLKVSRAYSDPRIRIVADGSHLGLVTRLNQAISLSRGKYFARMDGDDISFPDRLARQVEYLEQNSDVDLLGGGMVVFGENGRLLGTRALPTDHQSICRRPWAGFHLAHPTWMGRIEWFLEHPYRPDAVRCEDQDLLLQTYESSRFAALPENVLGYREESLSLEKILLSRRSFARSVARQAIAKQQYGIALLGVVEQTVKGLADCVAIGTGLNHRLLRHRALSADEGTKRKWAQLWEEVQKGTTATAVGAPA